MKICLKCDKPIDEDGEDSYVMIITKRKNKITDFVCFHLDCLQEQFKSIIPGEVKEKMNKCSICGKELRFWSSYVKGENYYCKTRASEGDMNGRDTKRNFDNERRS